jgi:hypothetical protein
MPITAGGATVPRPIVNVLLRSAIGEVFNRIIVDISINVTGYKLFRPGSVKSSSYKPVNRNV